MRLRKVNLGSQKSLWSQDWTQEFDPGSGRTLAACLTHASRTDWFPSGMKVSGERVSNVWATCLCQRDNSWKRLLIRYMTTAPHGAAVKDFIGQRWAHIPLGSWWDNSPPSRRWVAELRGWSATLGLRHGPDSYGRQQWGILGNGGNSDPAMPRERWR